MTKAQLLDAVTKKVEGLTKKQAGEVVDAVFEVLTFALCDESVDLKDRRITYNGFGTFAVKEVAARSGRNPRTNEPIEIKASKKVTFKAAPKLKVAINGEDADIDDEEAPVEVKKDAKKADKKDAAPAKKAASKKAKK
ncbi:MAG: HU family DNA-binding protein [Proteobacteria bacterium]|nr:HU family DNA-binding protein [Pseudomonadota bacterium]MBQ9243585.1 HU family DNA-binding protein [Pseudomonadota bacterium]